MMKKLLAIILAASLAFGVTGIFVNAAQTSVYSGSVTVKNVTEKVKTQQNSLSLYKILSYAHDSATGNFNTVSFVEPAYQQAFLKAIITAKGTLPVELNGTPSATKIIQYVSNELNTAEFAANLAAELKSVVGTEAYNSSTSGTYANNEWKLTGVSMGYYLIVDNTPTVGDINKPGNSYQAVLMLQPMKPDIVVTLKSHDKSPPEKTVVDSGDGDATVDNTVNIGDILTFKIVDVVNNVVNPSTGAAFSEYIYTLKDTMTPGLEYVDGSAIVTKKRDSAAAETIVLDASNFTVSADLRTLTFQFDQTVARPGDVFTVTYKTRVTKDAFSSSGNVSSNKVDEIYFGSDGSSNIDGIMIPPVEIKTYGVQIVKTNETGEAIGLSGEVKFVLRTANGKYATFQQDPSGVYYNLGTASAVAVPDSNSDGVIDRTDVIADTAIPASAILSTDANGKIEIRGFAFGTYYLDEIATQKGYNLLSDDVDVVIDAVTIKDPATGAESSTITLPIKNYSGMELPGTGGIGTVWFTIIGLSVMTGAAGFMFMIFRKKKV